MIANTKAIALLACLLDVSANALAQEKAKDTVQSEGIEIYQVDVAPAPVSAAGVVGLGSSAITTIQTAQDIAVLWGPLSSKDSQNGFGLSITPSRVNFVHVGAAYYMGGAFNQAVANLTLSYAQNFADISGVKYKKDGYSIDTYFYLDAERDPVVLGYRKFQGCAARKTAEIAHQKATREALAKGQPLTEQQEAPLIKATGDAQVACDKPGKSDTQWNDSRIAISIGKGYVEKDLGGNRQSLGQKATITGLFKTGTDAGLYLVYQRTRDAIDPKTLDTSPSFKSASLVAARYVRGTGDATLRYLIELSNANDSNVGGTNSAFKRAIGIDKQLAKGVWLQFRYGKGTSSDGKETQNKGLLNVAFAGGCLLNGKCDPQKKDD